MMDKRRSAGVSKLGFCGAIPPQKGIPPCDTPSLSMIRQRSFPTASGSLLARQVPDAGNASSHPLQTNTILSAPVHAACQGLACAAASHRMQALSMTLRLLQRLMCAGVIYPQMSPAITSQAQKTLLLLLLLPNAALQNTHLDVKVSQPHWQHAGGRSKLACALHEQYTHIHVHVPYPILSITSCVRCVCALHPYETSSRQARGPPVNTESVSIGRGPPTAAGSAR